MPLYEFEGTSPTIHETAFIAPTASVIGDVTIEEGASVWYGTVLRADFGPIWIRRGANVQDNSTLHGGPDGVEIGEGATVGHNCVVHGARVGKEALIGNGAIVLDGAVIGDGTLVAAGAVVTPSTEIPSDRLWVGAPAKDKGEISGWPKQWATSNQQTYRDLAQRHKSTVTEVEN
ncbi:gamma carbonic anhydrase family protein [Blastococcus sp. Marseille-P5729]|uniref:gamma carbonic anhydrase family protein n=1 Tax=Blastococcus sp. Marseille-P5729 TaxID=2086582 RepID=UPI000D0EC452|nr:gamma carbonic anhydrase family protein [Blastococcus sp. Marseille-P5729]